MKKTVNYKEIQEANYIMKMMKEDVFGHRVTSWSPADTARLHRKLNQPISDKEKEQFVAVIEPRMLRKSYMPTQRDQYLDSFLDIDTRISQSDYETAEDPEEESLEKLLGVDLT